MSSDLIILYHRQPFAEIVENGERRLLITKAPTAFCLLCEPFLAMWVRAPGLPGKKKGK